MDGVLIGSVERFENNAVLVSGFTGHAWTDGQFVSKKHAVSKISGFVWTEPNLVPVRRLPRPSQSMHFSEKFLGPRDPKRIGRAQ